MPGFPLRLDRASIRRHWRLAFIVVWIALQLAIPLSYYAGRRDPHDERFAWRMFSPTRMVECRPQFTIDGKPFDANGRFHEAWNKIAERGHFAVVEAMGAALCRDVPGKRIELRMTCQNLDGTVEHWGGYDVCTVPEL